MDDVPGTATPWRQFIMELDETPWHATMHAMEGGVCVRIERRDGTDTQEHRSAIEICRVTLAEAVARARTYLTSECVG